MASVSVIIVNYKTARLALKAVESVLPISSSPHQLDVHLVDNASPDDDARTLTNAIAEHAWTTVILHCESENHGFARANNLVLRSLAGRKTPPDYVFFLNPDAFAHAGAVEALITYLEGHNDVAIAGPKILTPHGKPASSAFRFPTILSELEGGLAFGPVSRLLKNRQIQLSADHPTGNVDWVSGAAMMCRFSALHETRFFDPDYFLYFEEVDLSRRLTNDGWRTALVAHATVTHIEGASTQGSQGESLQETRLPDFWHHSWRLYFLKNHGKAYAIVAAAARLMGTAAHQFLSVLRGREAKSSPHSVQDFCRLAVLPILKS